MIILYLSFIYHLAIRLLSVCSLLPFFSRSYPLSIHFRFSAQTSSNFAKSQEYHNIPAKSRFQRRKGKISENGTIAKKKEFQKLILNEQIRSSGCMEDESRTGSAPACHSATSRLNHKRIKSGRMSMWRLGR